MRSTSATTATSSLNQSKGEAFDSFDCRHFDSFPSTSPALVLTRLKVNTILFQIIAGHKLPSSMKMFITVLALVAGIAPALATLPAQHSKHFPLRYDCDVAPGLAGWTLISGSTVLAAQASNSWLSFITSLPQISAYRNSQWNVASDQAYTSEIRFRTPRRFTGYVH